MTATIMRRHYYFYFILSSSKAFIHARGEGQMTMLVHDGALLVLFLLVIYCSSSAHGGSWFSSLSDDQEADIISVLVSPIVNRELEASVVAHAWPFAIGNVICEAWAYHASNWDFMDTLVASLEETPLNAADAKTLVLKATPKETDKALLEYALSLRAYSPQCELHRGLARQVLFGHGTQKDASSLDAFVVAGSTILSNVDQLAFIAWDTVDNSELVPGEVPRMIQDSDLPRPVVVLYANMTTKSFISWYKALVDAQIPFVLRHLGNVWFEETGDGAPTTLQGYGVRLDIRNVEYRVFDDRDEGVSQTALMLNVSTVDTLSSQFLAGVNVSALVGLSQEDALQLQASLFKIHEAQQLHSQIIPPTWQRRQLSLQAATAVASSSRDVLMTLRDISQNLPSVASTLVHIPVSEEYMKLAEELEPLLSRTNGAALLVNGRRVPIDRPSFNVFEFVQMLKKEQTELEVLQERLSPFLNIKAMQQVQHIWSMGEDALKLENDSDNSQQGALSMNQIRIDVGRGWKNAVVYANDIENDAEYAQWPRQVKSMVMAMQYGAPPSVRRNMFTILAVADPLFDEKEHVGIQLASQLMQSQFPARLGMLIVNSDDLEECSAWIRENQPDDDMPCPVKPIFESGTVPSLEEMPNVEASTQAMFKIFAFVNSKYGMAASAYLQILSESIGQAKEQQHANLTLYDLIMIHGQIMGGWLQLASMEESVAEIINVLTKQNDDSGDSDTLNYGSALRFALNKSVQPGMGFINGRPLPTADDESSRQKVGEIFMEEQNHIMQLVMDGVITDSSPKSVYAHLLTGDRVFERVHPLLTDSLNGKDSYVSLNHGFDSASLVTPKSQISDQSTEAIFLVEAVSDLDSVEGRTFMTTFIEMMESLPGKGAHVSVAYRLVPSTTSGQTRGICTILAHASLFKASHLLEILKRDDISSLPATEILDTMTGVSSIVRDSVTSDITACSGHLISESDLPPGPFVVANGRVFSPDNAVLNHRDIELLLDIEKSKAKKITKLMIDHLSMENNSHFDAVAQTAIVLAEQNSNDKKQRSDMEGMVLDMEKGVGIESNPLRFFWNGIEDSDSLKIKVTAVVDPVSEPTQRMVPLLLAVRDHLKLPLTVILAPRTVTDDNIPITSYYRFVADPQASPDGHPPRASFSYLPANHVLTLRLDVPESWNVQQTSSIQDTDNLRCDVSSGCGDVAQNDKMLDREDFTRVEYGLKNLIVFGQCYEANTGSAPNGLQLTLSRKAVDGAPSAKVGQVEIGPDGTISMAEDVTSSGDETTRYSDTLVMKNVGYWQLRANPGVWNLNIAPESRGAEIFDIVRGTIKNGRLSVDKEALESDKKKVVVVKDFVNRGELLVVKRREGYEKASLFYKKEDKNTVLEEEEVINVFSLATGHLYERFLKIMMLSVTKRTSSKVKFWLFENFLSPGFKASALAMAERIGCQIEFVTYKWPEWLRGQSEKQRIIWGYKILFLDVLFPLSVKKIIYVDADQVVRADLKELWDMDLKGAPYGYTPMCSSREETLGFQFWRSGFWKNHLRDKPYHISALYVVDLANFRRNLVGDNLRAIYQQLSADPNSLANLDQDLPNYAQHQVPIFSLPQEWLWCESWCSDDTKPTAKTIDLCNNPLHKEPKVSMAKRVISGELFEESWVELDEQVERYEQEFKQQACQVDDSCL